MFLLSYIFIAVVVIYIGLAVYLYKLAIKHYPHKKFVSKLVLAFFILLPTYDIIITNTLGAYHCLTTPPTYINKKVEYPESIYWEDNVYPGFNAEDRKLMIMNYLDGVHLKTMALNGDDGKIYTYETNASVWEQLKPLEKERGQPYYDMVNAIAQNIMETSEQIYTKETMPKLNYTVTFNEVKLNPLSRMFLYLDETKIVNNQTGENIAHNLRVMRQFYNLFPAMPGQRYYQQSPMCGDWYEYHIKIFDMRKWRLHGFKEHQLDLSDYLYKKYIKGEK